MIVFPNCKINIGLQVIGKRTDGYHDLETIFYPIAITDALEIIDAPREDNVSFSTSGISLDAGPENNLCVKAYKLLKKDFPRLPGMKMHLHKIIPVGAGMGGGSADAVFTLQLLNNKYALGLDLPALAGYAFELGSDCPFFLLNKTSFASGRGEILEPVALDLDAYKILIVHPGIHVNTGWAFSVLEKNNEHKNLKELIAQPVPAWRENIRNDFEIPVFKIHPELRKIKENLYDTGALYASMSGSGSTVYAIYKKTETVDINFPAHYFYKWV